MTISSFVPGKTPGDSLPFAFDWADWVAVNAVSGSPDTIVSATMTATPSGLTIGTVSVNSPLVVATISGGVANVVYTVTCVITTNAGFIAQADERLPVVASVR